MTLQELEFQKPWSRRTIQWPLLVQDVAQNNLGVLPLSLPKNYLENYFPFYTQEYWNPFFKSIVWRSIILEETSCFSDKNSTHNVNRILITFFKKKVENIYFSGQKNKLIFFSFPYSRTSCRWPQKSLWIWAKIW